MAVIMDGKAVSAYVRDSVKKRCEALKNDKNITPGLAVILAGDDSASRIYVRNKAKACAETGILSKQFDLPGDVSEDELIGLIERLNSDDSIHGILVQLPLPEHIDQKAVIRAISPQKDADAFSNESIGRLFGAYPGFLPCTPAGILKLLDYYKIDISGRECVVVGRSAIVGKPLALMLLMRDATVTVCHSKQPI